jgi:hypothetical protein
MRNIIRSSHLADDGKVHVDLTDDDPEKEDKDIAFQGSIVGDAHFNIARYHAGSPKMTADIVMTLKDRRFVGPDEHIVIYINGQKTADKRPGEAVGLVFYPSPDGRFLAVDRKIYRGLSVLYAYRAEHGRLLPLRFGQMRLDEWVIDRFLHSTNQRVNFAELAQRVFHFERWENRHILRINFSLSREEDTPGRQGFAEIDLAREAIVQLREVTGQGYNFFPNVPARR